MPLGTGLFLNPWNAQKRTGILLGVGFFLVFVVNYFFLREKPFFFPRSMGPKDLQIFDQKASLSEYSRSLLLNLDNQQQQQQQFDQNSPYLHLDGVQRTLLQLEGTEDYFGTNSSIHTRDDLSEVEKAVGILLLIGLEGIAYLCGYILHKHHFKYLQEAGLTMMIGSFVGILFRYAYKPDFLDGFVHFDSQFFFLVILPPIIFESGYNMSRKDFFFNIAPACGLAFLGTFIATISTSFLTYVVSNYLEWNHYPLELIHCFVWGSIISATDTVSILAVFKDVRVDIDLYSTVFGESVLNDAVAIMIYRTVRVFEEPDSKFDFPNLSSAALWFILIFVGSLLIGLFTGLGASLLTKFVRVRNYPIVECCLVLIFAYSSYLIADALRLSGIVTIVFCGITMAHYTWLNLSEQTQQMSADMFAVLASLCDTLTFVYLGLALFMYEVAEGLDWAFICTAIPIVLLSRALHVFPVCSIANFGRPADRKLKWQFQVCIWFAGFRGAMAFALANEYQEEQVLLVEQGKGDLKSEHASRAIFATTLSVILFTVLICGGIVQPVLDFLKVPRGLTYDSSKVEDDFHDQSFIARMDRKYLRPFFTRHPPIHTPHHSIRSDGDEMEMGQIEQREGFHPTLPEQTQDGIPMQEVTLEEDPNVVHHVDEEEEEEMLPTSQTPNKTPLRTTSSSNLGNPKSPQSVHH